MGRGNYHNLRVKQKTIMGTDPLHWGACVVFCHKPPQTARAHQRPCPPPPGPMALPGLLRGSLLRCLPAWSWRCGVLTRGRARRRGWCGGAAVRGAARFPYRRRHRGAQTGGRRAAGKKPGGRAARPGRTSRASGPGKGAPSGRRRPSAPGPWRPGEGGEEGRGEGGSGCLAASLRALPPSVCPPPRAGAGRPSWGRAWRAEGPGPA